jgi:hypothetical protein
VTRLRAIVARFDLETPQFGWIVLVRTRGERLRDPAISIA